MLGKQRFLYLTVFTLGLVIFTSIWFIILENVNDPDIIRRQHSRYRNINNNEKYQQQHQLSPSSFLLKKISSTTSTTTINTAETNFISTFLLQPSNIMKINKIDRIIKRCLKLSLYSLGFIIFITFTIYDIVYLRQNYIIFDSEFNNIYNNNNNNNNNNSSQNNTKDQQTPSISGTSKNELKNEKKKFDIISYHDLDHGTQQQHDLPIVESQIVKKLRKLGYNGQPNHYFFKGVEGFDYHEGAFYYHDSHGNRCYYVLEHGWIYIYKANDNYTKYFLRKNGDYVEYFVNEEEGEKEYSDDNNRQEHKSDYEENQRRSKSKSNVQSGAVGAVAIYNNNNNNNNQTFKLHQIISRPNHILNTECDFDGSLKQDRIINKSSNPTTITYPPASPLPPPPSSVSFPSLQEFNYNIYK